MLFVLTIGMAPIFRLNQGENNDHNHEVLRYPSDKPEWNAVAQPTI